MKVVYIAHPLGPDGPKREWNRRDASKWVAWLCHNFAIAPVADWIIMSGEWAETEENRALGLSIDLELVARCDEIWLTGERISAGMQMELDRAAELKKPVHNLTGMPMHRALVGQAVGMAPR